MRRVTRLLAQVRDLDEADEAAAGGADIVELDDATVSDAPALARRLQGRARASLLIAGPPVAVSNADFTRVDWPSDGTFDPSAAGKTLALVSPARAAALVPAAAAAGLAGLMIDTTAEGRLLERAEIADLADFVAASQAAGLLAALGGRLEAPDVPRLLRLAPDILGFRGALRRNGRFDAAGLALIRALMPHPSAGAMARARTGATDRVFVRDYIVPASIGAYGGERGAPQRVRFNVDVDVGRLDHTARDMRDVFSYDLVLDAIRLILARGHVALVETLADEVAAAVLQHPRVARVDVRVEKLDMIDGTLGVAISRTRDDAKAMFGMMNPRSTDMRPTR